MKEHGQVDSMEKYLTLHGVSAEDAKKAAAALCGDFDFAGKGTLKAFKKAVVYFAREGYAKAPEGDGGSGDPVACCILEICC